VGEFLAKASFGLPSTNGTFLGKQEPIRESSHVQIRPASFFSALVVMLTGGLEGIKKGYGLAEAVEANIYRMDEKERARMGGVLPGSHGEG